MNEHEILIVGQKISEWKEVLIRIFIRENGFVDWDRETANHCVPRDSVIQIFFENFFIEGIVLDYAGQGLLGPKLSILGEIYHRGEKIEESTVEPFRASIGEIHVTTPSRKA